MWFANDSTQLLAKCVKVMLIIFTYFTFWHWCKQCYFSPETYQFYVFFLTLSKQFLAKVCEACVNSANRNTYFVRKHLFSFPFHS